MGIVGTELVDGLTSLDRVRLAKAFSLAQERSVPIDRRLSNSPFAQGGLEMSRERATAIVKDYDRVLRAIDRMSANARTDFFYLGNMSRHPGRAVDLDRFVTDMREARHIALQLRAPRRNGPRLHVAALEVADELLSIAAEKGFGPIEVGARTNHRDAGGEHAFNPIVSFLGDFLLECEASQTKPPKGYKSVGAKRRGADTASHTDHARLAAWNAIDLLLKRKRYDIRPRKNL